MHALAAPPLALLLWRPVRERITEPRMGSVVFSQRRRHDRGNLSCHLRELEDAGDVTITKSFANARPKTTVQLNAQGRAAFDRSTAALGAMLRAIG